MMKLRIRDNSIRLRLTRTEVGTITTVGIVSGRVTFAGDSRLIYCLESSPACVDPSAQFANGELSVRLPEATVAQWANSDDVSIEAEQSLDGGDHLKILVEKDFSCLAPREGEEESDLFPHPDENQENG
jgi:hypothetical protein